MQIKMVVHIIFCIRTHSECVFQDFNALEEEVHGRIQTILRDYGDISLRYVNNLTFSRCISKFVTVQTRLLWVALSCFCFLSGFHILLCLFKQ